jgi:hypothetical protein
MSRPLTSVSKNWIKKNKKWWRESNTQPTDIIGFLNH